MPPTTPPLLFLVFSSILLVHAALPLVDYDRMGKVAIAGPFAGLDFFQDNQSPLTFDPSSSTLFTRDPDGSLTRIASTSPGGRILSACSLNDRVYVAGEFSSIDGTEVQNLASYDPSTRQFSAVGSDGPNGEINTLYCDQDHDKVWAGGRFSSPSSAVAIWEVDSSSWTQPPFNGLTGAQGRVQSISLAETDSHLLFSGSFLTTYGGSPINSTNNPRVPFSPGASPFSSSLVPIPLQNADVDAAPSSSDPQFSDIQNALCPNQDAGDGPGNSWHAQDGSAAFVTIRTFTFLQASGIRLGNTFQPDHRTTGFSVTTIPDNAVRTLRYVDPNTGENRTCSNPCPLSTDSEVLYQDFLFEDPQTITGVQIELSEWSGNSAGLHIVQLLSSGAFAGALADQNQESCYAPSGSGSEQTGQWTQRDVSTDIPGTQQQVLVSEVDVGTSTGDGPSFTWYPYVSASGEYEVNLLVPRCVQDCDSRTTVQIEVFPGGGQAPIFQEVDQRREQDTPVTIYRGPVIPTTPDFQMTVVMKLSSNPTGQGQNGKYTLVADRVHLVLISPDLDDSSEEGEEGASTGGQVSFGILDWPRDTEAVTGDATSRLPQSSLNPTRTAGVQIARALGVSSSSSSSTSSIRSIASHESGAVFFAGAFNLSSPESSNIVLSQDGELSALADGGLNGQVSSIAISGDLLFVGGTFTNTAAGNQDRLRNVAMYNIPERRWLPMEEGVDGPVAQLTWFEDQIQIVGNFTRVLAPGSSSLGSAVGGLAAWDVEGQAWQNSGGFLSGAVGMINTDSDSSAQYVAGNIEAFSKWGASGLAILQNSDNGQVRVSPMGVPLAELESNSTPSTNARKRHAKRGPAKWFPHFKLPMLRPRQSPPAQDATLPVDPVAPAPAVLSGVFWTNSSSSQEVVIVGGNFSLPTDAGASRGVAIYNPETPSLSALPGEPINGIVRALLVKDNRLYVGGRFTIEGTNANGFAVYDLDAGTWVSDAEPLQGSSVLVRSITTTEASLGSIIVAGTFTQGDCNGLCSLDIDSRRWSALGSGFQGDVSSIAYAGDGQEILIAGGALSSSDSPAYIMQYAFPNSSWNQLGNNLPGPVTAVEVNNGNVDSVFAAGSSSSNQTPFLHYWDGSSWNSQGVASQLQTDTVLSSLSMVPLQDNHAGNGVIESDRMLMLSGSLVDPDFGSASAVLYDGQSFIPYISSSSLSGTAGAVSSFFHSFSRFSFERRRFLATGIVILISIAVAAGVVFLLALIGIVWTLLSRRDDKANSRDTDSDADDDSIRHRPSSLLEHINAATRTTIIGGASTSPYGNYHDDKDEERNQATGYPPQQHDPFMDAGRAETPSDMMGGMVTEDMARPAHARYSFDGAGEGELALSAGTEIEVLDDRDHAWWYARDPRTGKEGVVPAAYLY